MSRRFSLNRAFAGFLVVLAAAGCSDGTGSGEPVASVTVSGAPAGPLLAGGTVQLVATGLNSTGAAVPGGTVEWSSSDTLVAKVNTQGLVSAVGAGPVTITASIRKQQGSTTLDVRAGGVLGIDGGTLSMPGGGATLVLPANALSQATTLLLRPAPAPASNARLVPGTAIELGPEGTRFARFSVLTLRYDASRLPTGVGQDALQLYMLSSGAWVVVRGSQVNTAARTVTGSITGSGTYAVLGTAADTVTLRGPVVNGAMYTGQTAQLSAVALDVNRDTLRGRVATWATSDAARATVDGTGKVTAVSAGTVTITATVDGKAAATTLAILARPAATWNHAADWSTFQGNAGHRGDINATVDPSVFRELWTVTLADGVPLNQVATGDGKLFASSDSYFGTQRLWTLEATTGAQLWVRDFGRINSVNPPSFGNGRVYVQTSGHQDSFLWSFDATDGTQRFRTPYSNQWSTWAAAVVADSGVYAGGGYYGGMFRLDATTGVTSYFIQRPQYDEWTPAVSGGLVFSYGGGGTLTATNSRSGTTAYVITDTRLPSAATPVVSEANRVLGATGSSLFAVDLANRRVAWAQAGSLSGTPVVSDGVVYVFNGRGVDARQESDGTLLWNWPLPAGEPQRSMVVTKNVLFVTTAANTYAVDLSARRHTWSYPAGGQLSVSREGLLVIAQSSGKVTAISLR